MSQMDGQMERHMDKVKTVYPQQMQFAGGIIISTLKTIKSLYILF